MDTWTAAKIEGLPLSEIFDKLPLHLQFFVRAAIKDLAVTKIILFGSHAQGKASPDSDIDLLIVMHVSDSKRKKTIEIYRLLAGMGIPKDVVLVTPEEFEKYKNVVGTIIWPAFHEGKLLYERVA